MLTQLSTEYANAKLAVAMLIPSDLMHCMAGLAVAFITSIFLRDRMADFRTFIPVVIIEAANEAIDAWYHLHGGRIPQFGWPIDTMRDIVLTLGPPLAVWWVARYRPHWIIGRDRLR